MSRTLCLLTLTILFFHSPCCLGESDLMAIDQRHAASEVAKRVMQIAGSGSAMFVREFRGIGESNVGLANAISEELIKQGIKIERGAPVEVEGRILRLPVDDSQPMRGYTLNCTVVLSSGSERKFSVDVMNRDEGFLASGHTGETAPSPEKPRRSRPEMAITIEGQSIRPAPGSPYGVEFLVERQSGQYDVLTPTISGHNASVKVHRGDIVAIRLINDSQYEAAAQVLVDGLSRFALATESGRRNSLDLIQAVSSRDIIGYFRDADHVDAFRVGEYSTSPAAKLLPDALAAGTFTIAFHAAWKIGGDRVPNEPPTGKGVGINQGPPRKDPTQTVQREIGRVRAVIKVFYNE